MLKMCKSCPYRKNGPFKHFREDGIVAIDTMISNGTIPNQPHGCHSKTEEMIVSDVKLQCIGHKRHLEQNDLR
jgi:hypothetical protein